MQSRSGFYKSASWRQRRKRQLEEHPHCAGCGAEATIADHIDPIGLGGDWFGPLQSLCKPCHDYKTAAEGRMAQKLRRQRK